MIRLLSDDPHPPIDLLQQYHPHHLMRKGHPGKREPALSPLQDLRGQPQRPADDKCRSLLSLQDHPLQPRRHLQRV